MTSAEDARSRKFPLAVFVLCGGAGLALLLTGTVPALAEQSRLRQLESRRQEMLELLQRRADELRRTEVSLDQDPQTLLLEIDKLGLTPDELLAEQPEEATTRPGGGGETAR